MKLFFNRNILVLIFFVIGISILVSYKQTEHMTNNKSNKLKGKDKNNNKPYNHHNKPNNHPNKQNNHPNKNSKKSNNHPNKQNNHPNKHSNKSNNSKKNINCPKVYMRGNNYFVYINPQSKYSKSIGSGEFPYGSDRKAAKRIFELNFPDCKVPDLFKYGHRSTKLDKNCPFKVKMGNPCLSYQCSGVDFSKDTTIKNNECKRVINHYCELNKDIDDACMCWKKENRNNPTCARKRREMKHPDDFHCNINYFKITEHPDLKNYIRKDKIPCWNCNMNGKNIEENAERTWDRVKEFL